jgi:hypothetical protein
VSNQLVAYCPMAHRTKYTKVQLRLKIQLRNMCLSLYLIMALGNKYFNWAYIREDECWIRNIICCIWPKNIYTPFFTVIYVAFKGIMHPVWPITMAARSKALSLRSLERWDHGFISHSRHGCLCAFIPCLW